MPSPTGERLLDGHKTQAIDGRGQQRAVDRARPGRDDGAAFFQASVAETGRLDRQLAPMPVSLCGK